MLYEDLGRLGRAYVVQACRPELKSPESTSNPCLVFCTCNVTVRGVDMTESQGISG